MCQLRVSGRRRGGGWGGVITKLSFPSGVGVGLPVRHQSWAGPRRRVLNYRQLTQAESKEQRPQGYDAGILISNSGLIEWQQSMSSAWVHLIMEPQCVRRLALPTGRNCTGPCFHVDNELLLCSAGSIFDCTSMRRP